MNGNQSRPSGGVEIILCSGVPVNADRRALLRQLSLTGIDIDSTVHMGCMGGR
jgi:hypothetical protein